MTNSQYFVYGKEVGDFHALNKDYIFTINVCATQELSRKVDALQSELSDVKQENAQLAQENAQLKSRIDQLCAHLGVSF